MKKTVLTLLAISSFCFSATMAIANPYAVTSKFPSASVNKCIFVFNEGAPLEILPSVINGTESECRYDLIDARNGSNLISVQYKNIWGVSSIVPFSFAKTLPPTPLDITLAE